MRIPPILPPVLLLMRSALRYSVAHRVHFLRFSGPLAVRLTAGRAGAGALVSDCYDPVPAGWQLESAELAARFAAAATAAAAAATAQAPTLAAAAASAADVARAASWALPAAELAWTAGLSVGSRCGEGSGYRWRDSARARAAAKRYGSAPGGLWRAVAGCGGLGADWRGLR